VNCREAERLIDTFYDGELDGRSMRDAAMHITRCKRCESELSQREQLQKLLSSAIEAELADVDLGRIWAAVEPTLEQPTVRGLSHLRRLGRAESPRLAAASSRVGGLLLGRQPAAESVGGDGDLDPSTWDAPESRPGRAWRWSLAGGAALAASVLLAIALVPGPDGSPTDSSLQASLRAAGSGTSSSTPSQSVAQRATTAGAGAVPFDVARADLARPARAANKQVQVESVNFPRSSVAMWSEPASDTTVIWIEDEELTASGRR